MILKGLYNCNMTTNKIYRTKIILNHKAPLFLSLYEHLSTLQQRGEINLMYLDLPGPHWVCKADGGHVQCWHWCLHSRADRIWWSLWSLGGSFGAAAPSDPSPSAPSIYHSSADTPTVCTPAHLISEQKNEEKPQCYNHYDLVLLLRFSTEE